MAFCVGEFLCFIFYRDQEKNTYKLLFQIDKDETKSVKLFTFHFKKAVLNLIK